MAKQKKKVYRFTGREGSFMSENLLKKWIQNHEDHHEIRAHFFGKEILMATLMQPGCTGIRFYHAIDDKGNKTLVLVGADAKGENIWSGETTSKKLKGAGGGGGDGSYPCPPYC